MHKLGTILVIGLLTTTAVASTLTTKLYSTKDGKTALGTVTFKDSKYGVLIEPKLHGLTPGLHGFHIHVNHSCAKNGMAAGGHFDPTHTGKHRGPYNDKGHLGDLPVLYVNAKGIADVPTLAPRLNTGELHGHSLMVHAKGDNYSDIPAKLGGGGARVACGLLG